MNSYNCSAKQALPPIEKPRWKVRDLAYLRTPPPESSTGPSESLFHTLEEGSSELLHVLMLSLARDQPLLPSSGSWPLTLDWALLSRLDTSLSSAPWKCSRKASGLWSWGCKCLTAHTRSDTMRRHNLADPWPVRELCRDSACPLVSMAIACCSSDGVSSPGE